MTAEFGKKKLDMTFYTIIPSSGICHFKIVDVCLCDYFSALLKKEATCSSLIYVQATQIH